MGSIEINGDEFGISFFPKKDSFIRFGYYTEDEDEEKEKKNMWSNMLDTSSCKDTEDKSEDKEKNDGSGVLSKYLNVGWKLHVSVKDNEENIHKAWVIIKNIVSQHKIADSKVVVPGISLEKDPEEAGNQFTIYCFKSPKLQWGAIINEIEQALINSHVVPDGFNQVNKRIKGSRPSANLQIMSSLAHY